MLANRDAADDDDDDDDDDDAANAANKKQKKGPRPFDFLCANEFVRTTLKQHLESRKLATEAVVRVEYVEVSCLL